MVGLLTESCTLKAELMNHKTIYELAYTVEYQDGKIIVVIMAETRENFHPADIASVLTVGAKGIGCKLLR